MLVVALVLGLMVGLVGGLVGGLVDGLVVGAQGLVVVLLLGFVSSPTGLTTVTWLEEARKRDVLRTVGAVYQFRHAKLQDQLSDVATTNKPTYAVQRPS